VLKSAFRSGAKVSVQVVSPAGDTKWFVAIVREFNIQAGSAENVTKATTAFEIDSPSGNSAGNRILEESLDTSGDFSCRFAVSGGVVLALKDGTSLLGGSTSGGVPLSDYPDLPAGCSRLSVANGLFMAVGRAGGVCTVYSSLDGLTWNSAVVPVTGATLFSVEFDNIVYGSGVYAALNSGFAGSQASASYSIAYSSDLVTWAVAGTLNHDGTNGSRTGTYEAITNLFFADGYFIYAFMAHAYVARSTDAHSWVVSPAVGLGVAHSRTIAVDNSTGELWCSGANASILHHSVDGGLNWDTINISGIGGLSAYHTATRIAAAAGIVFMWASDPYGTRIGVMSFDNGATWAITQSTVNRTCLATSPSPSSRPTTDFLTGEAPVGVFTAGRHLGDP